MGLLEKLAALPEEEQNSIDTPTEKFFQELDLPSTCRRTLTNSEFAALKQQISELRNQIMGGTFLPTTDNLRTIVAWFRASREEGFTVVPEKKTKEKAPAKPKRISKKKEMEQKLLSGDWTDLL